jgi:hypothetical protein
MNRLIIRMKKALESLDRNPKSKLPRLKSYLSSISSCPNILSSSTLPPFGRSADQNSQPALLDVPGVSLFC